MLLLEFGHGQTSTSLGMSSLFQCQLSTEQSGQVFTPNIPDFYFNHNNIANFSGSNLTTSRMGFTYIFTIPSMSAQRNCSGTVVAIQYCYQHSNAVMGSGRNAFHFLILTRNESQFRVKQNFVITTNTCTSGRKKGICCDRIALNVSDQFQINSTVLTFGVVVGDVSLLAFANTATEYNIEQFQVSIGTVGALISNTFNLHGANVTGQSLLLLRFFIGMFTFKQL